jgi:ribosomal protein S27AE
MDFANEYKKNIEAEMIKAVCPKCKTEYKIYPEHLGRAECGNCETKLVKA